VAANQFARQRRQPVQFIVSPAVFDREVAGFIVPCLPTKTHELPSGGQWLHEIKHDGFRVIARKHGERVTHPTAVEPISWFPA
jgi:bifunctional non-homologous end joining protein LigD